ncbi:MAG: ABC-ATPase domain-containing protein [Nitrospirales bacterium]
MKTGSDLRQHLLRINGHGYKAYKALEGAYDCGGFTLFIDHVQGDPFAAPSTIRVRVAHAVAGFPVDLWTGKVREVAFRDYLTRSVYSAIQSIVHGNRGIGKSGLIFIDVGGQEVLERTAMVVGPDWVEARLEIGLPASGRTILGKQAEAMICQEIPKIVEHGLRWERTSQAECRTFVNQVENFSAIQSQLASKSLVAFVADGALLPRASGVSDRPLSGEQVVCFQSPEALRVSFEVPHPVEGPSGPTRVVCGLGIPCGVTLIVGGGYHGKSTLLQALQRGVYPHIPGDGREFVVTSAEAVKIPAEDGRRIEQVNISGFIRHLPQRLSTHRFSTDNASGSTSQAAGIMEALEVGAGVLMFDEDTSATNFMVRDARMQALVHKEFEPITPLLDRVKELFESCGVSTILVMGGCGDYFDVANTVIMMKEFLPKDVTAEAQAVAQRLPSNRQRDVSHPLSSVTQRIPRGGSVSAARGKHDVKIAARSVSELSFGNETIHLQGVEQLVDSSQTRATGYALHLASRRLMNGKATVRQMVEALQEIIDRDGLDTLSPFPGEEKHPGNFARPRNFELAAVLNRLRSVHLEQGD